MKPAAAYPVLGKRFGKRVPEIAGLIGKLSQKSLGEFLRNGEITLVTEDGETTLGREEMAVAVEGVAPYGGRHEHGITVALNLEIDDSLRLEGVAREMVNRVQNLRKKAGFEVGDRIRIRYEGGKTADCVFASLGDLVMRETLAKAADKGSADWKNKTELEVEGESISLWIERI